MHVYRLSLTKWPIPVVTTTILATRVCGLSHLLTAVVYTSIQRACMRTQNYEVLRYTSITHVSLHTRGETISVVMWNPFCVPSSQVHVSRYMCAFPLLFPSDSPDQLSFLFSHIFSPHLISSCHHHIIKGAHFIAPVLFDPKSPPTNTSLAFYRGLPTVIHNEQVRRYSNTSSTTTLKREPAHNSCLISQPLADSHSHSHSPSLTHHLPTHARLSTLPPRLFRQQQPCARLTGFRGRVS